MFLSATASSYFHPLLSRLFKVPNFMLPLIPSVATRTRDPILVHLLQTFCGTMGAAEQIYYRQRIRAGQMACPALPGMDDYQDARGEWK